jgi:release factor glutamine methyltransferase
VTTVYTDLDIPAGTEGVYAPQEDSQLLVDIMEKAGLALWNSGRAT